MVQEVWHFYALSRIQTQLCRSLFVHEKGWGSQSYYSCSLCGRYVACWEVKDYSWCSQTKVECNLCYWGFGWCKHILGLRIKRDIKLKLLFLSLEKNNEKILHRFNMVDAKSLGVCYLHKLNLSKLTTQKMRWQSMNWEIFLMHPLVALAYMLWLPLAQMYLM